jgi:ubiquinone/menaquinone biosynthesis C-methylase UbiE
MCTTSAGLAPEQIWQRYDADERRLTASVSERMLELARLQPGMHVLDLATGRGEPAIRAAHRVAPGGTVLGIDTSAAMLQMAAARAAREGAGNLELRVANAETLEGVRRSHFHAVLARWGLMYFDAPVAALSAARSALMSGGVLVAAVWAEPGRVPYFSLPRRVLSRFTPVPPNEMDSPGTFYYSDMDRMRKDLMSAGFVVQHIEEIDVPVMEAATDSDLIEWTRAFGLARLLAAVPLQTQRAWECALLQEVAPLRQNGYVRLGGVSRLVVASPAV